MNPAHAWLIDSVGLFWLLFSEHKYNMKPFFVHEITVKILMPLKLCKDEQFIDIVHER